MSSAEPRARLSVTWSTVRAKTASKTFLEISHLPVQSIVKPDTARPISQDVPAQSVVAITTIGLITAMLASTVDVAVTTIAVATILTTTTSLATAASPSLIL